MKQAIQNALDARGYTTLTPVQQAVTKPELTGRDLLVSAQTGSGKTLGFGLAIAPGLFGDAETFGPAAAPLALIIAPTRELAMQVKRELSWLYAEAGAVVASTVGGMDTRDERRALARGAHVVVATPGRLRDHIVRGSIDLSDIRAIVLDEADEMLDLGFREDLEFILDEAPEDRQTLLFSATVPAAIAKLAQKYQRDAERVATVTKETQHADITYRALTVSARDSENAIINVLRYYEAPNAIVFCNTRAMVSRLTTRLSNRGLSVVALSGELSQNERTHALQAMRDGRARVCVATDVAARGIDLPNLDLVIHAELPSNQDTLLHRSGRTGRAGRKGVSALIVPPAAKKKAHRLLGWAKLKADWAEAPSAEEVTARDDERMLADFATGPDVEDSVTEVAAKLVDTYSPEQIATAYVQLFRQKHSAPEELSEVAASDERKPFGPSVWFSVEGGRAVGAEPRQLLPMLCRLGNLTREDLGAIRIQPTDSFFEVRESAVDGFLKALGAAMTGEDGAQIKRLASAPDLVATPYRDGRGKPVRKPRRDTPKDGKGTAPGNRKHADRAKPSGDAPMTERHKSKERPQISDRPKRDDREKPSKPAEQRSDAAKPKPKPKPHASAADSSKSLRGDKPRKSRGDKPKGPPPPKGKPNSKKNRARRAARTGGSGPAFRKPGKR